MALGLAVPAGGGAAGLPDLRITQVQFLPAPGVAASPKHIVEDTDGTGDYRVSATVKNFGTARAPASAISVFLFYPNQDTSFSEDSPATAIEPGASFTSNRAKTSFAA